MKEETGYDGGENESEREGAAAEKGAAASENPDKEKDGKRAERRRREGRTAAPFSPNCLKTWLSNVHRMLAKRLAHGRQEDRSTSSRYEENGNQETKLGIVTGTHIGTIAAAETTPVRTSPYPQP